MSANGESEVIQPQPGAVPFSVDIRRLGMMTLESGETVPLVQLGIADPTGTKIVGMPGPFALRMAEWLREAAGGLTIAQTTEGIELG